MSPLEETTKLDMVKGTNIRIIKDPLTLAKLEYGKKLQVPHITNSTGFQKAIRAPHPAMDKIEIHQNVFIEVQSGDSDITVLPIEINWDFLALLRHGPLMKYGRT